jgi:hypothetical protein
VTTYGKQLKVETHLFWLLVSEVSAHNGGEVVAAHIMVTTKQRKREFLLYWALIFPLLVYWSPHYRMVPPTFRAGLS